ncbi:hypothetical protein [Lentzea albidocapillata]|uniref:hypothetical protein n=1 Tax=Lentzea albidocapillata TaxID=40571 RepID=UPI0012FB7F50|nr:hypothetical protein [Lentzea albidocapillata]
MTAEDNAVSAQLRSRANWMTPYRVSCARAVARQVKARGLDLRAAHIAFTTVTTETHFDNISVAEDHDSLGLFQQRPSMGWGSPSDLINPVYATNKFLDVMLANYPNGAWRSGDIANICQKVQKSGFPDGSNYRANIDIAGYIANVVWNSAQASSHGAAP